METLITQPIEPSGSSEAAASPRWVLLWYYHHSWACDSTTAVSDGKTIAAAKTSRGRDIQVSFNIVAPPAISTFYFDCVGGAPDGNDSYKMESHVTAAHDNCILFDVIVRERHGDYGGGKVHEVDYFLYEAATGRPPSLSRLPACYFPNLYDRREPPAKACGMDKDSTGLLRRGEDGLLVAELKLPYGDDNPRNTAKLCNVRSGGEWELRVVPIIFPNTGEPKQLMEGWRTDVVVPVGDRFLCWVDYLRGFLLGDMAEASPKLRYVAMPFEAPEDSFDYDGRRNMKPSRKFGAAGVAAVKFVTVGSRCCCGGPGSTTCVPGRFAFTVTTWTLNLATMDEPTTTWVKDGVLDCEELWALPGYEDLPRVTVEYPILSVEDPEVVCFTVCNDYRSYLDTEKRKVWLIEVDMRRKVLTLPCPLPVKMDLKGTMYR